MSELDRSGPSGAAEPHLSSGEWSIPFGQWRPSVHSRGLDAQDWRLSPSILENGGEKFIPWPPRLPTVEIPGSDWPRAAPVRLRREPRLSRLWQAAQGFRLLLSVLASQLSIGAFLPPFSKGKEALRLLLKRYRLHQSASPLRRAFSFGDPNMAKRPVKKGSKPGKKGC